MEKRIIRLQVEFFYYQAYIRIIRAEIGLLVASAARLFFVKYRYKGDDAGG